MYGCGSKTCCFSLLHVHVILFLQILAMLTDFLPLLRACILSQNHIKANTVTVYHRLRTSTGNFTFLSIETDEIRILSNQLYGTANKSEMQTMMRMRCITAPHPMFVRINALCCISFVTIVITFRLLPHAYFSYQDDFLLETIPVAMNNAKLHYTNRVHNKRLGLLSQNPY